MVGLFWGFPPPALSAQRVPVAAAAAVVSHDPPTQATAPHTEPMNSVLSQSEGHIFLSEKCLYLFLVCGAHIRSSKEDILRGVFT